LFRTFTKKTKDNKDNTGSMESQRSAQAHPTMMTQSGGSMANSGVKKKIIQLAKRVLVLQCLRKNK
jgi:hypothetical protein